MQLEELELRVSPAGVTPDPLAQAAFVIQAIQPVVNLIDSFAAQALAGRLTVHEDLLGIEASIQAQQLLLGAFADLVPQIDAMVALS